MDVANFSTRPICLAVGMLLAEVEQVKEDWVCSIIKPGPGSQEETLESPYQDILNWEPVAAVTDKDIGDMLG
jgi:hypothetical protein